MAEALLKFNKGNRKVKPQNLKMWEKVLRSGTYKPTHQGIAIEGNRSNYVRILDGQHRLMAVVNTGITAMFNVTWDCDPTIYENIDGGFASRSNQVRTGIEKAQIECCSMVLRIMGNRNPIPSELREIQSRMSESFKFKLFTSTTRKLARAPVRTAFAVYNMTGLVGSQYHDFVNGEFQKMSASLCVLYKKCINDEYGMGDEGRLDCFNDTIKALENPKFKRLVKNKNSIETSKANLARYINNQ